MLNLEVNHVEDIYGVEQARRALGELVSDVSRNRKAVVITRRTREKAVLVGYEEYRRLVMIATDTARNQVLESLDRIHRSVCDAKLPDSEVEKAIRETRAR